MSRIKGIFLLFSITLALTVAPGTNGQTNQKPLSQTTAASTPDGPMVEWCCLAGLACCVPNNK